MEKVSSKDFFPKEVTLGKEHAFDCSCEICLQSEEIYDKLVEFYNELSSNQVKSYDSKKICSHINADLLEELSCTINGDFQEQLDKYEDFWNKNIEGQPLNALNEGHEEGCDCAICSLKNYLETKLDDLCSNKSFNDSDLLEVIDQLDLNEQSSHAKVERHRDTNTCFKQDKKDEDNIKSYLVCGNDTPVILSTKDGIVEAAYNANTGDKIIGSKPLNPELQSNEIDPKKTYDAWSNMMVGDNDKLPDSNKAISNELSVQKSVLKPIELDQMIDFCLCENRKLSPYCLKHSVAYCQHMQTKLYGEGCTCTKEAECLFCERLRCNYCKHERTVDQTCPTMNDPQTNELSYNLSKWIDKKLLANGVSKELIDKFSEPSEDLEAGNFNEDITDENIQSQIGQHLDNIVKECNNIHSLKPVDCNYYLNDKFRNEVLDINQLFDVRTFPRCYKLKGVKNEEGIYSDIKEEMVELGIEAWKVPTQFVEDTIPLSSNGPDLETRLDKEDEIRKRTRNQKQHKPPKNIRIKGLQDDWRPIIEVSLSDGSDYSDVKTLEQKQEWAQKIFDEIMSKCEGSWQKEEENPLWSKIQPILNKYSEEVVNENTFDINLVDVDNILKTGKEFAEKIFEKFPKSSSIGYKPEFWIGLENWKPDESENEVRKQLNDEVKKFVLELDLYKNDFERALTDRPGIEINPEAMLNDLILSLPESTRSRVIKLKSELPSDWIQNPEKYLNYFENSISNSSNNYKDIFGSSKTEKISESLSESENLQDFEDEDYVELDKNFFYDDEEIDETAKDTTDDADQPKHFHPSPLSAPLARYDTYTLVSGEKSKLCHRPAPYIVKLKEDMIKNSPDGLHPAQKIWYDKPMFPFWTPSAIYDLSEIDRLFFDGVPDYMPDLSNFQFKEVEKRLFETETDESNQNEVIESESTEKEEKVPPVDETDVTADVRISSKSTSKKKTKTSEEGVKKSKKKSAKKVISDEDCLIKEDDFKAAMEQFLTVQASKKEKEKDQGSGEAGGALSLAQIKQGVAGKVKSICQGAIELDSNIDINLESVVPFPAFIYPFELDIFQKQAIIALEAGLSVFVAAHTSAGKTVAAEYAIAMAQRNGCRVVYTSPIKALSNQKYNDFSKKFKGQVKVGIITGDVQLNKEAECLIMTTEILRSMLYNQSSILSDLEFVIFDEVHYFNDPERGNVWEEVLILLPHQCQLVMLSATVPDVMNFASWVGTLRKREVIVTTTYRRPVPLNHFIHYSTLPKHVDRAFPVKVGEGKFLQENFNKAMMLKSSLTTKKVDNWRAVSSKRWIQFIKHHLKLHNRLPAVIFCFSRKGCDDLACSIQGNIDLVEDPKKKKHIENFFNRQINNLQPEDREIRQIVRMKGLLQRGIGVHHSGILPILKEIVEVLFSESQIKLLIATETFAMGVNMPAKTVVFYQVVKFDGESMRPLNPGEYTQMAGRAGRRGIDKSGTVIITEWKDPGKSIQAGDLSKMLTGSVAPLQSQLRLRYSMILTALKPEVENSIHAIIEKSFFQFSLKAVQMETNESSVKDKDILKKVAEEMKVIPNILREQLAQYCSISYQFLSHHDSMRDKMFEHRTYKQYLTIGRLVTVSYERYANVYGIILGVNPTAAFRYDIVVLKSTLCCINNIREKYPDATDETVDLWVRAVGFRKLQLLPLSHLGRIDPHESFELIQCKPLHIIKIVKNCLYKINKGLAFSIVDTLQSPRRQYNPGFESLMQFFIHAMQQMHNLEFLREEEIKFNMDSLHLEVIKYHKLSQAFDQHIMNVKLPSPHEYPLLDYLATCFRFHEKNRAIEKRKIEAKMKEMNSHEEDFRIKLQFLKNNKYIKEDDDVLLTKGRIASRMTNFEVFVTEILLKNVLEDLDGPETAALLSCLIIPGVNTDNTDNNTNADNPLFKKIECEDDSCSNIIGNVKKNEDMKKIMNKLQNVKKESQKNSGKKANEILIKEYLELTPSLKKAISIVNDIKNDLITQEKELDIMPMEGADLSKITFYLVPIVYAWTQGKSVCDIMKVLAPTIQEGILVKWIIKLSEAIKDIDSATHHFLKDSRIKEKFDSACNSLKRGIIDTPSLYLNQRSLNV